MQVQMDLWSHLVLSVVTIFTCVSGAQAESSHDVKKRDVSDLKLVCYYSNWAVYRPGLAKFTPQNINPYLCTHLIYAFASLSPEYELSPFDPYNDMEKGNYKTFVGLKAYNSNLKTMIAVGGWNEGSKRFSRLVESPEYRQKFIKSALHFLRENGFDGLDLDWEYPAFRDGGNDTDKSGYAQLVKEFRSAIDRERLPPGKSRLLLSVAVPAIKEYIDLGFDVSVIAKNADFLNLLTYDYHTAYEPETDHHAPLFVRSDMNDLDPRRNLNVEWTVDYYIQQGAPKEKIIIGIPTYGRSYTLTDQKYTALESPADGPGDEGLATREKGYLAYYEICQKVKDDEWEVEAPYPHIMGPYAYKGNQWVGFDDEEMISLKARFIVDRGLGGAMVWTLDNDDFRGLCTGEQNPLVNALRSALLSNTIEGSSSQRSVARSVGPPDTNVDLHFDDEASTVDEVSTKPRRRNTLRRLVQNRQSARRANSNAGTSNVVTTPVPPPTPDPGFAFECKDEGFFNNPRDCKKYFWCLDSGPANLGIVAHAFTCPSGLYFNSATESCDYPENVACSSRSPGDAPVPKAPTSRLARPRGRAKTTARTTTTTTTTTTEEPTTEYVEELEDRDDEDSDVVTKEKPQQGASSSENVAELLRLLQAIGGVEKLQSLLGSRSGEVSDSTTSHVIASTDELSEYTLPKRAISDVHADTYSSDETIYSEIPSLSNYYGEEDPYKPATLPPRVGVTYPPEDPPLTLQVPRRPQFESPEADVFQYVQPQRSRDEIASERQPEYHFDYQNPTRGHDISPGITYVDEKREEGDADAEDNAFSYEAPIRSNSVHTVSPTHGTAPPTYPPTTPPTYPPTASPTRPPTVLTTEPPTRPPTVPATRPPTTLPTVPPTQSPTTSSPEDKGINEDAYRTPIRVQVGRVVRIQNAGEGNNGVRRRMRVRVKPAASTNRIPQAEQQGRAVGRLPEDRRVAVVDPPKVPVRRGNGGERVAVRRRPAAGHGFENASLPGVRLVTRSRRPQDLNDGLRKPVSNVDYVSVRRVPVSEIREVPSPATTTTTVSPTTEVPTTTTTTTEIPTAPYYTTGSTTKPGYHPPIYQPPFPSEAYDDYEDEYTDGLGYEDGEFVHDDEYATVPVETTTTTPATTTTTGRPRRPSNPPQSQSAPRSVVSRRRTTPATTTSRPQTTITRVASASTRQQQKATTTRRPSTSAAEDDGRTIVVRSDTDVDCFKRGVFIHPEECSKFVVCAPASRSTQGLRGRVLNCPANQIYLEDIGRCMKGDRTNCEQIRK